MDESMGPHPVFPVLFSDPVENVVEKAENALHPSVWSPLGIDIYIEWKVSLQVLAFLLRPYIK